MTAITYPITGVTAVVSATRSPSFTLGTSPVENDILVAFISSSSAAATTDVSGWTNVLGANVEVSLSDSTTAAGMAYHRVTAAEDAANTVTWTLTNYWDATEIGRISVAVLRNVATTGELVGSGTSSNITTADGTIPTVTPTADAAIIAGLCQDGTGTRTSAPTGYTDIAGASATQHNWIYRRTTDATSGVATGDAAGNTTTNDEYISIVAAFKDNALTGTLATTNAADTSAASGGAGSSGTLARTNAADTSAASGGSGSGGTLATTNAADTVAASGTAGSVSGTLATTNAADTSTASGTVTYTGTSATTNAADTVASSGTVTYTGSVAVSNAADTSAASGGAGAAGTTTATNADDTSAASGYMAPTGTADITNTDDTLAAVGDAGAVTSSGGGDSSVNPQRRRRPEPSQPPKALRTPTRLEPFPTAITGAASVVNAADRCSAVGAVDPYGLLIDDDDLLLLLPIS